MSVDVKNFIVFFEPDINTLRVEYKLHKDEGRRAKDEGQNAKGEGRRTKDEGRKE